MKIKERTALGAFALALVLKAGASAETRLVVSNCCQPDAFITELNPLTLKIANAVPATPAGTVLGFAPLNGGRRAVILSNNNGIELETVDLVTKTTGAPYQLTLNAAWAAYPMTTNPKTSSIYVAYTDGESQVHLQELSSTSTGAVQLLRDVVVANAGYGYCYDLNVSPDGTRIYVGLENPSPLQILNASDFSLVGTISTEGPVGFSPDSSTAYIATTSLYIVDNQSGQIKATVPIPFEPNDYATLVAVSPNGNQVYLATASPQLFTYTVSSGSFISVTIPGSPSQMTDSVSGLVYLNIGPMEPGAIGQGAAEISLYDPTSQTVTNTAPLAYSGLLLVPAGGAPAYYLYFSSSEIVQFGSSQTRKTVGGPSPGIGDYDPDNGTLLLPAGTKVNVFDADTLSPTNFFTIPYLQHWVGYSGGFAYAVWTDTWTTGGVEQFSPITGVVSKSVEFGCGGLAFGIPTSYKQTLYVPFNGIHGNVQANCQGIAVIDKASMTLTAVWPFDTSTGVPAVAVSPDGTIGYVLLQAEYPSQQAYLLRIDLTQNGTILQTETLGTAVAPALMVISPDGHSIYCLLRTYQGSTLLAVNAQTLAIDQSVSSDASNFLDVTPDGTTLVSWAPQHGGLTQISTATLQVVGVIPSTEVASSVLIYEH